ncbi:hypothetical protein BC830DRAFT_1201818 [Chytriomyces sp. MP71]|nr:hypothetical protein BC830DRAFT_1201818 [Chytriomyces sp. MP71]
MELGTCQVRDDERANTSEPKHWLWLTFTSKSLELEFDCFWTENGRLYTMGSCATLTLLSISMVIASSRSLAVFTTNAAIAFIVPNALNAIVYCLSLLSAKYKRYSHVRVLGLVLLAFNIAIKPVWTAAMESSAAGPSASTLIFQSLTLMTFPLHLQASLHIAYTSLSLLAVSFTLISALQPAMGDSLATKFISGYAQRFSWGSAFVVYALIVLLSWLYLRLKQRTLRKLFLLQRRQRKVYKILDSKGIKLSKTAVAGLWRAAPGASKMTHHGFIQDEFLHYSRGDYHQNSSYFIENNGATREFKRLNSGDVQSRSTRHHRPNTGTSIASSIRDDYDYRATRARPTSAFFRILNESKTFTENGTKGRSRKSAQRKRQNPYPSNIREIKSHTADSQWSLVTLFLGEPPWPTYNERRYLKFQARSNSSDFVVIMATLFVANVIISSLDNFDRIIYGSSQSFSSAATTSQLLLQLVPLAGIPLISIAAFFVAFNWNKLLFLQPIVLLSFWALVAFYLLSPLESFSSTTPDAFLQSKVSAYITFTILLTSQTGMIPARSFVPWCVSVVFLALMHVPLASSWSSTNTELPWSTTIQVILLVVGLAPLVRDLDARSREAFEALETIKCSNDLLHAKALQDKQDKERQRHLDQFYQQEGRDWVGADEGYYTGMPTDGYATHGMYDEGQYAYGYFPEHYYDQGGYQILGHNEVRRSVDQMVADVMGEELGNGNFMSNEWKQAHSPCSQKLQSLLEQCDNWIIELETKDSHEIPEWNTTRFQANDLNSPAIPFALGQLDTRPFSSQDTDAHWSSTSAFNGASNKQQRHSMTLSADHSASATTVNMNTSEPTIHTEHYPSIRDLVEQYNKTTGIAETVSDLEEASEKQADSLFKQNSYSSPGVQNDIEQMDEMQRMTTKNSDNQNVPTHPIPSQNVTVSDSERRHESSLTKSKHSIIQSMKSLLQSSSLKGSIRSVGKVNPATLDLPAAQKDNDVRDNMPCTTSNEVLHKNSSAIYETGAVLEQKLTSETPIRNFNSESTIAGAIKEEQKLMPSTSLKSTSIISTEFSGPRRRLLSTLDGGEELMDPVATRHRRQKRNSSESAGTHHKVVETDHPMQHVGGAITETMDSLYSSSASMGPAYLGLTPPTTSKGRTIVISQLSGANGATDAAIGRKLPSLAPIAKTGIPEIPKSENEATLPDDKKNEKGEITEFSKRN